MRKLHELFMHTFEQLGLEQGQLPMPVFNHAPVGISFEVGADAQIYLPDGRVNPVYLDHAFVRAKTLFDELPCQLDLLRIDVYPKEEVTPKSVTLRRLAQLGLSVPDESVDETYFVEDDYVQQTHLYWDLAASDAPPLDLLLLEIIKGDLGGISGLCSNVYFLAAKCPLLYYLYDDRGVDILAKEKTCLQLLYQTHNDWILSCDKEKIDLLFSAGIS